LAAGHRDAFACSRRTSVESAPIAAMQRLAQRAAGEAGAHNALARLAHYLAIVLAAATPAQSPLDEHSGCDQITLGDLPACLLRPRGGSAPLATNWGI
jgi:hypothetical protein